ncbi:MAG: acyltransferase [Clostridia bacterium]|nr:acyltransferase [Clostridia bacterium]
MERNVLVDRLKGYACFLVLCGHVIMGIRLGGIHIPEFFGGMEKFIWSFHVSLFLFLSGVVYKVTGEWKNKKTKCGFLLYKLYNLAIPYIVFSAIYVLINSLVGESNTGFEPSDILNIWKSPVAQYWFLYALFFLFCIWTTFSGILKNWQITIIAVLIGYLAPIFDIPLGSLDVVFYSALAFGIGTCIDFKSLTKLSTWAKCLVVILHIVTGIIFVLLNKIEAPFIKEIMILFGIYSSIMFISILQNSKIIARFLDFINKYSFQIYLLHTIFTAGIRIILLRLNINQWWIHVLLGTACGLVFSVLSAKIAKKVKCLNFFFFPSKVLLLKQRKNSSNKMK